MFPLVHFYVNKQIYDNVPHLMALGAIYPDLATSIGIDREYAHTMGENFYDWCKMNYPSGLPLARGIISHGINPKCVDYYADEYHPGCNKGWCFMLGKDYIKPIALVTNLPINLIWWKAHSFVEISFELIIDSYHPYIKHELNKSIQDQNAINEAANILSKYHQIPRQKIKKAFETIPNFFSLNDINAISFAQSQNNSIIQDHQVFNANPKAMSNLLLQMSNDLLPKFSPYFEEVIAKIALELNSY